MSTQAGTKEIKLEIDQLQWLNIITYSNFAQSLTVQGISNSSTKISISSSLTVFYVLYSGWHQRNRTRNWLITMIKYHNLLKVCSKSNCLRFFKLFDNLTNPNVRLVLVLVQPSFMYYNSRNRARNWSNATLRVPSSNLKVFSEILFAQICSRVILTNKPSQSINEYVFIYTYRIQCPYDSPTEYSKLLTRRQPIYSSPQSPYHQPAYLQTLSFHLPSLQPVLSSRLPGPRCYSSKQTSSSEVLQTLPRQVKPVVSLQLDPQLRKDVRKVLTKPDMGGSPVPYSRGWDMIPRCSNNIINVIELSAGNNTHTCHHFTISVSFVTSAGKSFRYRCISNCHPSSCSSAWLVSRVKQWRSKSDRTESLPGSIILSVSGRLVGLVGTTQVFQYCSI